MSRRNLRIEALSLIAVVICLGWLFTARSAVCQQEGTGDIVEEDLGFELEALLARAEEVFQSADQPSSIPLFTEAVLLLERREGLTGASPEMEELLIRSLFFRAEASFNLGERQAAQEDLERILRMKPGFEADPTLVSRKLLGTLDDLRRSTVGYVELVLEPADARVAVDGEALEPSASPSAILAGLHTVEVIRPGFEARTLEIDLPAGEEQRHEVVLERTSAVIRLLVRPSGATVLVDGQPASIEESTPAGAAADSGAADFTIWDLEPGRREIEIKKDGFRTAKLAIELAALEDYGLPPVRLEPTQGTVVLDGVPAAARLLVNGQERSRPSSVTGRLELALPPGEHTIRVTAGPLGEFEESLTLADKQTLELGVELRPSLVFLGVLGGDRSAARDLAIRLTRLLGDLEGWALLDRSSGGANVLLESGVDTMLLRRLASGQAASSEEPAWSDLRGALDRELQGSLYLQAVLTDDLFATHADLWLWAAQHGPARPRHFRLPIDDANQFASFAARLETPIVLEIPWVGARFADSAAAEGPVVLAVAPGGPAEQAGLVPGDVIRSISGEPAAKAAEIRHRVVASGGADLVLEVGAAGAVRSLNLQPAIGPRSISLTDPDLLDPAAAAVLAREASRGDAGRPKWLLDLNRALLYMRAGEWRQVVLVLREIQAPTGPGLGQAAVDYWLGVALLEADRASYEETARGLFARAVEVEGARLHHNDGPLVVTRARARLESKSP